MHFRDFEVVMRLVVVGHVAGYSSDEIAGSGNTDSHIILGFSGSFDCDAVFVSDDVHFVTCERFGGSCLPPVTEAYWLSIFLFVFDDFNGACVADEVYFATW